jgi:NADH dehydrogenase
MTDPARPLSPEIVTIFGGSGFLGRSVVAALVRRNYRMRVAVRRPNLAGNVQPFGFPGQIHPVQANLRYPDSVARAVRGAAVVINLVGILRPSGRQTFEAVHAAGARAVAEAAAAAGARLIHVSTDLVFRGDRGGYREDDPPAPVSEYGRSKAEAERVVRAERPDALVVRTSLLYGGAEPGPQERLAARGGTFFVDEIRSPLAVGDLADALLELAELDLGGILHLGGADDVSRYELALLLGADPARVEAGHTTPDRAPNVSLDSSRARALLRTRLRGVREVLA